MAVYTVESKNYYIGLSTDKKPTTPVFQGSEYLEIDTGKNWIWFDDNWMEDLRLIHAVYTALQG